MKRAIFNKNQGWYVTFKRMLLLVVLFFFMFATRAQVTIGSGISLADGLLLDLKQWENNNGLADADKGIKLPRVALTNINSLAPLSEDNPTQKIIHKGTAVYNVKANGSTINEGVYYWDGTSWIRLVNEIPSTTLHEMNMKNNITTSNGSASGSGGTTFSFPPLTIPEDGSYAFSFRLYGGINGLGLGTARCVYYISVWAGTVMVDIVEIDMLAISISGGSNYSYSVTLGGTFKREDNVTFKIASITNTWTLMNANGNEKAANRTSMIWWKL